MLRRQGCWSKMSERSSDSNEPEDHLPLRLLCRAPGTNKVFKQMLQLPRQEPKLNTEGPQLKPRLLGCGDTAGTRIETAATHRLLRTTPNGFWPRPLTGSGPAPRADWLGRHPRRRDGKTRISGIRGGMGPCDPTAHAPALTSA
jgi:hypothetical protein